MQLETQRKDLAEAEMISVEATERISSLEDGESAQDVQCRMPLPSSASLGIHLGNTPTREEPLRSSGSAGRTPQ
jgi:hypothetical protein